MCFLIEPPTEIGGERSVTGSSDALNLIKPGLVGGREVKVPVLVPFQPAAIFDCACSDCRESYGSADRHAPPQSGSQNRGTRDVCGVDNVLSSRVRL